MTITESPAAPTARTVVTAEQPSGLYGVVTTGDHKVLGRLYIGLASLAFIGILVLAILHGAERLDTGSVDVFADATTYLQLFSLYQVGLVFLVALPLLIGLATAIVPLQVGSPTIAFPRAAAAAFWIWLLGSGIVVAAYLADGGLSVAEGGAADEDAMALTLLGVATVVVAVCLASVCLVTTVVAARAPGMTLRRVPLFSWSMLVAGAVWLITLPVLLADLALAYVDFREGRLLFGVPETLDQQIAWTFQQPQVYAFAIPVLGILSEVLPVASRVRQQLHDVMLVGIGLFGFLTIGAGVRAADLHDNFLYPALGFVVVVPLLILLGGWGDTLRRGRPSMSGPLGALVLAGAGVALLAAGVLSGALRVVEPLELLGTATTDGVATLVLLAAVASALGGVVYWAPKLSGRTFPEASARTSAPLVLVGAGLVGIAEVISGLLDQPAGPALTDTRDGVEVLNTIGLVGWAVVAFGFVVWLLGAIRLFGSAGSAPADPWGGHTLEWATASPPPIDNFADPLPEVPSPTPLLDVDMTSGGAGQGAGEHSAVGAGHSGAEGEGKEAAT